MSQQVINTSSQELQRRFGIQRAYFDSGQTRPGAFRNKQLQDLKAVIKSAEADIIEALKKDFNKPAFETFASEIGFIYEELNYTRKHLAAWMKRRKVKTPLTAWPSQSYILPQPKGVSLVIGPWNYPFQLMLAPVIAALAAGNTVILKPSEKTPATALLIEKLIHDNFPEGLLTVIQGEGHVVIPELLEQSRPDHLFFTGSVPVGRKIAEMTAPKLIPTTLELGGKSPAIIDYKVDMKTAVRRIAFGKWLNAGQTCVAPDYILVDTSVEDEFLALMRSTLEEFYPEGALASDSYAGLIDQNRFEAMQSYLKEGEVFYGGQADADKLRLEPTIIRGVSLEDRVMQEEIFGPVLPVIPYSSEDELRAFLKANPNPLAFYVFSGRSNFSKRLLEDIPFGGGARNNALIHLANPRLPFGGIGDSGIGNYHGKYGFDTFTHYKGIMESATWFDLKAKYPPYAGKALRLIQRLMR